MKNVFFYHRRCISIGILLLVLGANVLDANPTGGSVAGGNPNATISGEGTGLVTINQTAPNALINWQTFNIGAGETVNFNQPSSTSVTWNQINDPNPNGSTINGNINAIGYVILQNPNGFTVGGQASITAHGLIMTTASTPALNLSSGGPWSFNAPPPTKSIVNYGQINITGGGMAFLIADDIENNGTISAPGGKIGLYAGQKVLVSTSPDGRGLSAQVTVPQGLVDNNGNLVADGGSIVLQAQMVNQNGLIQANSAQNVNGTIELVAGSQGSLNLGASSAISANGDPNATTTPSSGGFVVLNSDNTFAVASGSTLSVSGTAGGQDGVVEIFDPGASTSPVQPSGNYFALLLNPYDLTLSSSTANTSTADPTLGLGDLSAYSQIDLQALDNITLSSDWSLPNSSLPATLSLTAGNNVMLNSSISAGNNWGVNLTAGTSVPAGAEPPHISDGTESDGIYLNGSAYIQAQNGNINLNAANEVIVGSGGITTIGGGNIDVTAQYGDVNSGTSVNGFNYLAKAPYYTPFYVSGKTINYTICDLGGISTAAGGNVAINAGGDVISFPTTTVAAGDPGTGAFGPEAGNVTINAGGNVYGNYIVMNGAGTINAGNIGTAANNVALSLAKGSWNLNAGWDPVSQTVQSGIGDIYLQEVRNPNGVFNDTPISQLNSNPSAGNHLFDYDPQASVSLTAGDGVYLTGNELPRLSDETGSGVPLLLPPIMIINAGPGGVNLQHPTATDGSGDNTVHLINFDITLFPSAYQNLEITTTDGGSLNGNGAILLMSDSGRTQWFNTAVGGYFGPEPFGEGDHASVPVMLNNDEPATINLAGSMLNLTLITDKATDINIAGDMDGCSFYGENLQATGPASITSITVGGQIYNAGSFTSVTLDQPLPTLSAADTPLTALTGASLSSWFLPLLLALNPSDPQSLLFPGLLGDVNGFLVYNPNTRTLTAIGPMSEVLLNELETPTLTVPRYNSFGIAVGTDTINWMSGSANASLIASLYTSSQNASLNTGSGAPPAYVVGGTGQFNVTAGSIALGNSGGILSVFDEGGANLTAHGSYSYLAPYVTSGATINVTVLDPQQIVNGLPEPSLYMPASAIAALGGGDVNVSAPDGAMDLGSQELLPFENDIMNASKIGLGIYTTASGNVTVTALGTINIDSSRIATFDGGNIFIESYTGDVNAGSGGTVAIPINYFSPSYSLAPLESIPANGIVAGTLTAASHVPPGAALLPGNITVITPQGSIIADLGGISQAAFGETLTPETATSTIGLFAGTPLDFNGDWYSEDNDWTAKPPLYVGNIDLGSSGVIGINVTVKFTGEINGKVLAQQNADVAGQTFGNLLVLAGGYANVKGGGGDSGPPPVIIGLKGVNDSGIGQANIFSSSINGGAGTLATSSSASSASQSAAGQTSAENQQQVASNSNGNNDDKDKKKKGALARSVGRVTVILHKAS